MVSGIAELLEKQANGAQPHECENNADSIQALAKGDDLECCKVFGYFTLYSQGPVRSLNSVYLGTSSSLHYAEKIMRKATYRYDFFVIEYVHSDGTLSRYYDPQGRPQFATHRRR
jgi:hypothetical protein